MSTMRSGTATHLALMLLAKRGEAKANLPRVPSPELRASILAGRPHTFGPPTNSPFYHCVGQ